MTKHFKLYQGILTWISYDTSILDKALGGMILAIDGMSHWANILTCIFAGVVLVILSPFIEILPLTVLSGLLVMVGSSMIKVNSIETD